MPFDYERDRAEGAPKQTESLEEGTCPGIPQCAIPRRKYRHGMCYLDGCPRRREHACEIRELLDSL